MYLLKTWYAKQEFHWLISSSWEFQVPTSANCEVHSMSTRSPPATKNNLYISQSNVNPEKQKMVRGRKTSANSESLLLEEVSFKRWKRTTDTAGILWENCKLGRDSLTGSVHLNSREAYEKGMHARPDDALYTLECRCTRCMKYTGNGSVFIALRLHPLQSDTKIPKCIILHTLDLLWSLSCVHWLKSTRLLSKARVISLKKPEEEAFRGWIEQRKTPQTEDRWIVPLKAVKRNKCTKRTRAHIENHEAHWSIANRVNAQF